MNSTELAAATLFTAINRQGTLQLWPVKLSGPNGKHNEWHRSAAEVAELAMTYWQCAKPNRDEQE
jgi:hypothetical protein